MIISFFYEKNPKITILFWVLVFSFTYLVLVYPMDSTINAKKKLEIGFIHITL